MESVGKGVVDAVYTRAVTVLGSVPLVYQGDSVASSEYVLFLADDEREILEWSDKDDQAVVVTVTLQFWGAKPRTLADRAAAVVAVLTNTPLSVSGWEQRIFRFEQNTMQPALTMEGQRDQYNRVVRIGFVMYPV